MRITILNITLLLLLSSRALSYFFKTVTYSEISEYVSFISIEVQAFLATDVNCVLICSKTDNCYFVTNINGGCILLLFDSNGETIDNLNVQEEAIFYYKIGTSLCLLSSCYVIGPNGMTWTNAVSYCANLGRHLVSIEIPDEMVVVEAVRAVLAHDVAIWLGATDVDEEGVWRWQHNGEVTSLSLWCGGGPDNWGDYEHCMNVWIACWNDLGCTDSRPYPICEHEHEYV